MARKEKKIIVEGIDKREVGYYSTPRFIADYIASELLDLNPCGVSVLDPAVGKEELLDLFYGRGKHIDSYDIVKWHEYALSNFHHQNFIDFYESILNSTLLTKDKTDYDYMIANPPYNCHEISYIKENKTKLKKLFPVGVYNMYSMFLSAMIDIAKDGCLIGVIICDSFLTSTSHAKLREQIFETCSVHQLILCPTDLFWSQSADVRTCILILQKGTQYQGRVKISNRPENVLALREILTNKRLKEVDINEIRLGNSRALNQIIIDVPSSIVSLFSTYPKLGTTFPCVTCISTGNDSKYLSPSIKDGFSVPFYKNPASRKFVSSPDAFLIDDYLDESLKVKDFMVRNKQYIGRQGIACSSMGLPFSAAYLPQNSVTGVNPTIFPPESDIDWLLSYLNSSLVTYLVRGVIIRSNMVTSGYINELPIISFDNKEKEKLSIISQKVRKGECGIKDAIAHIDLIIFAKGLFSESEAREIVRFSENLNQSV